MSFKRIFSVILALSLWLPLVVIAFLTSGTGNSDSNLNMRAEVRSNIKFALLIEDVFGKSFRQRTADFCTPDPQNLSDADIDTINFAAALCLYCNDKPLATQLIKDRHPDLHTPLSELLLILADGKKADASSAVFKESLNDALSSGNGTELELLRKVILTYSDSYDVRQALAIWQKDPKFQKNSGENGLIALILFYAFSICLGLFFLAKAVYRYYKSTIEAAAQEESHQSPPLSGFLLKLRPNLDASLIWKPVPAMFLFVGLSWIAMVTSPVVYSVLESSASSFLGLYQIIFLDQFTVYMLILFILILLLPAVVAPKLEGNLDVESSPLGQTHTDQLAENAPTKRCCSPLSQTTANPPEVESASTPLPDSPPSTKASQPIKISTLNTLVRTLQNPDKNPTNQNIQESSASQDVPAGQTLIGRLSFAFRALGLTPWHNSYIITGLSAFGAAIVVVFAMSIITGLLLDAPARSSNSMLFLLMRADSVTDFLWLAALVTLGPIYEEIIFRGLLFSSLNSTASVIGAATISSLMFALCHGDSQGTLILTGLGCVFCAIRYYTQSLWPAVICHSLWNGCIALYLLLIFR